MHRLHGHSLKSTRFHDLETASKTIYTVLKCLHGTDFTVFVVEKNKMALA